ncbi:MAG: ABC transporter permease [Gordonia sp. (in: high G+C Gram-positive bacteria)]|uniref:ABC transporter permease n=1 Tax=Gordonia sp. (in: high G+C Gram-positive bacteria) TaxID=84139 RepID=UPI0039E6CA4A
MTSVLDRPSPVGDTSASPAGRGEPAAVPAAVKRHRLSLPTGRYSGLLRLLSPFALLIIWQILSSTGVIPKDKLSPPSQVISAARETWQDGSLKAALPISLERVAYGLVLGIAVALVLGLLVGFFKVADLAIDPPLQMLRTVPFLGLIPLFVVWFGIGEQPKIFLIALGVMFPLYLNLVSGIQGVDPKLIEAGRSLGLGRLGLARTVVLPGALPSAFTGFRLSLSIAWLSLIVAEQINADAGLGYLVMNARTYMRNDIIVLGLVIYAFLGLASDTVVRGLESYLLRWRVAR